MTRIADILPGPVNFAAYRYQHLYIAQGRDLLILDPRGQHTLHTFDFTPERFASFGGLFAVAGPTGAAQLCGTELTLQASGPGRYTLPMAELVKDGEPLAAHANWKGDDVMGLPVRRLGAVTHSPYTGRSFYDPVLGVMLEPDRLLTFQRTRQNFGQLNGGMGELLFTDPEKLPELLVPYSYGQQNLHGAGFQGGYVFTPDQGRSWRTRRLQGFGVLTERAVLSVGDGAVNLIAGAYP